MNIRSLAVATGAAALLLVGLALGYQVALRTQAAHAPAPAAAPAERAIAYWYDPMRPDQHFDKPGKSPFMDMQLVPRYADEVDAAGVRIAPGVQQALGMRTALATRGQLESRWQLPATLAWNPEEEAVVSLPVDARVIGLRARTPLAPVAAGELLATVVAPDWAAAVAEAAALERADSADAAALRAASRQRLQVLGVTGAGSGGRFGVRAPRAGLLRAIEARDGQFVPAGMPLFRISGLGSVWVEAALPQAAWADAEPGAEAVVELAAYPGERFAGRIAARLPGEDPASRTGVLRIVLSNPDGRLAPGATAQVLLSGRGGEEAVLVPTDALVATGEQARLVVQDADGGLRAVAVRTGRSGGGRTEVLAGLQGGERVVVSGQFLVDSEASLSGALQRLDAPASAATDAADATEVGKAADTGDAAAAHAGHAGARP